MRIPPIGHILLGILGSSVVLCILWQVMLIPLGWPRLSLVASYLADSASSVDTYKSVLMTGLRAGCGMFIGFTLAVILGVLTGKTRLGWIAFFFLLMVLQKIPAIAMVHVFVKSKLGIGFLMTVSLAATVVLTFTWQIIHHRAKTLDPRELFALRVMGFQGWRLFWNGLLPHLGSALGGAARLGAAIALVLVVLGEWQGVWSDGTMWQYGLGIQISRAYDAVNSEARVLAFCVWLGALGLALDVFVQMCFRAARIVLGVDFKR
jgi:sulfonate transport system permease protein